MCRVAGDGGGASFSDVDAQGNNGVKLCFFVGFDAEFLAEIVGTVAEYSLPVNRETFIRGGKVGTDTLSLLSFGKINTFFTFSKGMMETSVQIKSPES